MQLKIQLVSCVLVKTTHSNVGINTSTVLNVCSSFDVNAINEVKQHEECTELAVSPTEEEVMEAIGKVKVGIVQEMVKSCGGQLMDYMLDLFRNV